MRFGLMIGAACAVTAAAFLAPPPAVAQSDNLADIVAGCSNPDISPAEALRLSDLALRMDDGRLDRQNRAKVAFNAGVAALDMNSLDTARARLDLALELDPALAPAYVSRAEVHRRRGALDAALADYNAAVAADPRRAEPHIGRGRLLLERGEAAAALEDLDAAVALQPTWPAPFLDKGRAHFALGQYESAVTSFSAAIARDPRNPVAWLNRGEARAQTGEASARNDFDRAVLLAAEWPQAYYARAVYLEGLGEAEASNADYMRAHQLGMSTPRLEEKVREISGG